MKKDTLIGIILGTIGGLLFAIGLCMCLIPEWNTFVGGVIAAAIGFIILLAIIPIFRRGRAPKERKPIDKGLALTWTVGVVGSLVMGFGMSRLLAENVSGSDMVVGMIAGIVGLLICVLNYPIYAYLRKGNQ